MENDTNKEMTKAIAPIKNKSAYSLIPSPIRHAQLLTILQKTPREHVYTRPAKGGGTWDYVTGTYVKKVLNFCFGWLWDFIIVDKGREGDQVWVQGRLIIKDKMGRALITKEQFGRAEIKFVRGTKTILDYGNDLKSASTDALKKCAAELGIASDIYGKNEFREIEAPEAPNSNTGYKYSANTSKATPAKPQPATINATNAYEGVDKEILKLRSKLMTLGARTEAQALSLLAKKTGIKWNDFKRKTTAQVRLALAKLLNSK